MVENSTLKFFEEQFAKAVQDKLDASRLNDDVKIAEAEKAAQDARDAVAAVKAQQELTVEVADGGSTLHRAMSDGELVQTKRGILKNKNERGARENPDVYVSGRQRLRPTRTRQRVREERSRS